MNQWGLHKTALTHTRTHSGAQCQNQLLFLFSTFFPIHHKIEFEFYSWCCQAHSNLWFPGRASTACSQLYYTTFTCTNNLGFNGTIHASKSFVRRGFLSVPPLPSGPQGQQKAIINLPKHQTTRDQFLLLAKYTCIDLSQRREGGDRGQVSGVFLVLSILCGFAELSYIPSNINSSFNNFA